MAGELTPNSERALKVERRAHELFEWAKDARAEVEGEWDAADEAYYELGPTHIDPIQQQLRLQIGIALPPPRVYARVGQTFPVVSQMVAITCAEPLRFKVQPRTDELEHQIAAFGGQALGDHWKDLLWFDIEQQRLALSVLLYNVGWLAFGWNPYDGPADPYDPAEKQGEVFLRTVDVREVYPDPSSVDDRDMAFLWRRRRLSPGIVPEEVRKFARAADGRRKAGQFFAEEPSNQTTVRFGPGAATVPDEEIEVADLFVRPGSGLFEDERQRLNEKDDHGLHYIFVNGAAFRGRPSPHAAEGVPIPFASARFSEDAQRRYGAGIARVLTENDPIISDITNSNLAQQKYVRKPIIVARPELDLKARIVPEQGVLFETDDPDGLKVFQGPAVTDADRGIVQDLIATVRASVGMPDVWFGGASPGLGETATGLVAAKSGSQLRAALVRQHVRFAFKRAMQALFQVAAKRYVTSRMVQVTGPSYPVRQMMIDGAGLTDLMVDVFDEPTFSSNPTIRVEQVIRLVGALPSGTFDTKRIEEWLFLPQSETALFDEAALDRANADEQAWRILRGELPPEATLHLPGVDNDVIHIERKRAWLKSALGRWARANNPLGWAALRADIEVRSLLLQQGMAAAAGAGGGQATAGGGSSGDLTQDVGGSSGAPGGSEEQPTDGVEGMIGRMNPGSINAESEAVVANRPRVSGGVS